MFGFFSTSVLNAISITAHIRTGSAGSALDWTISDSSDDKLRCLRLSTARAHQQPITVLESEGGRVISGSQDHTLKVNH